MNNPVGWFEIYVQDMARAQAFYRAVFDAAFTQIASPEMGADFPDMVLFAFGMDATCYGASGALVQMPGFAAGGWQQRVGVLPQRRLQHRNTKSARRRRARPKTKNIHWLERSHRLADRHRWQHDWRALHALSRTKVPPHNDKT